MDLKRQLTFAGLAAGSLFALALFAVSLWDLRGRAAYTPTPAGEMPPLQGRMAP